MKRHLKNSCTLLRMKKKKFINLLKSKSTNLRLKLCEYGFSNGEITKMMAMNLSFILSKGRTKKIRTHKGYFKAMTKYINKNKSNVTELLIAIFESLEQKYAVLQSSSDEEQKSIEIIEKQKQQVAKLNFQEKERERVLEDSMENRSGQLEGKYFIKIEQNSYEQEIQPEFQSNSNRDWQQRNVFKWNKSFESDFSSEREQGEIKISMAKKKKKKRELDSFWG